jgi:hypothetical protein
MLPHENSSPRADDDGERGRRGGSSSNSIITTANSIMAEVDFDKNVTSLYDAIGKSDWDKASHACRCNPIEAKTWVVRRDYESREGADGEGNILWRFLPLHSACARRPPSSFVIDLLNAYPYAARAKDESGMYPIHYACGNRASKSVIEELVARFPRALHEADPQGMLPLHYIAQWGPSEDGVVELLMNVYAEGALALNNEGMSPLDLCKEANYDDWETVFAVMEEKVKDLHCIGKRMELVVPRDIEARREGSLVTSTTEVRSDTISPISSSVSLTELSLSRSRLPSGGRRSRDIEVYCQDSLVSPTKPFPRLRKERSLSQSRRSSSRDHSKWEPPSINNDARDEISTPRSISNDNCATPRSRSMRADLSIESLTLNPSHDNRLGIASSLVSPRYCDKITPRSSGRGCSSLVSPRTPRSSGRGGFNSGLQTPRSSRSVVFHFTNDSIPSSHDMTLPPPPPPSPALVNNHLFLDEENMGQLQVVNHVLHDNMDAHYQAHLAKENMELRAKLASYEMIEAENSQLRAKLAKMQEVQIELSRMVEIFGGLTRM